MATYLQPYVYCNICDDDVVPHSHITSMFGDVYLQRKHCTLRISMLQRAKSRGTGYSHKRAATQHIQHTAVSS